MIKIYFVQLYAKYHIVHLKIYFIVELLLLLWFNLFFNSKTLVIFYTNFNNDFQ